MRIPCFFKSGPFEAAYVVAVLESKLLSLRETVEFLVDTGVSRTTICDEDAIKLGIDFSMLEKLSEGMLNKYLLVYDRRRGKVFMRMKRLYTKL